LHYVGAELCLAFAKAGARAVTVVDLDGSKALHIADQCRGLAKLNSSRKSPRNNKFVAFSRAVDVSCEESVLKLINDTEKDAAGPIDLFVANAGIGPSTLNYDTEMRSITVGSTKEWNKMMGVNLMQIVNVARHLIPRYLSRGSGNILITASAAGLLTGIGSAPYSASKAAAVSMAEWLSITYGSRGLGIFCLCPQWVKTPLLDLGMKEGVDITKSVATQDGILGANEVASFCLNEMVNGRFMILPHPKVRQYMQMKSANSDRWLLGMMKLHNNFQNSFPQHLSLTPRKQKSKL